MSIKSLEDLKNSVYFLYIVAVKVFCKLPLRLLTDSEYRKLIRKGVIVIKSGKVFVHTMWGDVREYDSNKQVLLCDKDDYSDCCPMNNNDYEESKIQQVVLYQFNGNEPFDIETQGGGKRTVYPKDYIGIKTNGDLYVVENFDELYKL